MGQRLRRVAVYALAGFAACGLVQAQLVALTWDAHGQFAKELKVPAGKFVEVCGKLPRDDEVRWNFQAGAPMDFNVHYHEGKNVHYPEKQDEVASARGVLQAEVAQTYCWMWSNNGSVDASLSLTLQLRR
jgi:hypothetical protein